MASTAHNMWHPTLVPATGRSPHWSQLLSAAIVIGDARRSLRAVDMKRRACAAAAAARPRPQTAGRAATAM